MIVPSVPTTCRNGNGPPGRAAECRAERHGLARWNGAECHKRSNVERCGSQRSLEIVGNRSHAHDGNAPYEILNIRATCFNLCLLLE